VSHDKAGHGGRWNACLQTLKGHDSLVNAVSFSHDSIWLALSVRHDNLTMSIAKIKECLRPVLCKSR
jgi:hypothetical protein